MNKIPAWMLAGAGAAGLLLLLALYAVAVEPYNLNVTHQTYELFDGTDASGAVPVKLVLISDIHQAYDYPEYFARAVQAINTEQPDLILIDGDLVDSRREAELGKLDSLGQLRAKYGVYATLGNHDYQRWGCPVSRAGAAFADKAAARLQTAGITVLRNEKRSFSINGHAFALVGLEDAWVCRSDYAAATAGLPSGVARVVMVHEPTGIGEANLTGKNLVLSGHTHCGQVYVPGLSEAALEMFDFGPHAGGWVDLGQGNGQYITCGLTPGRVRLFARPEVSVIELE